MPLFALLLLLLLPWSGAAAAPATMAVAAPLLHLHSGPGRGYPVLYSAEAGEQLSVLKRRTRWVKLQAANGFVGWAAEDRVAAALAAGQRAEALARFQARRGQFGYASGDFGGAATLTVWGSLGIGRHLALRASASQLLGRYSDGLMAAADLQLRPFPDWRLVPWVALGTGLLRTDPRAALVASPARDNPFARVGVGLEFHLTRRFVLHAEFMDTVLFTERNNNEEIHAWQAGFSAYF